MRLLLVLLLAAPDNPEPGPVPVRSIRIDKLVIRPVKGDARQALRAFLAAHEAHKQGKLDTAATGYVRFLGMAGRADLPERYQTTVRARVEAMRRRARTLYDKAAKLYAKDRAKGLAKLERLAERYAPLPEGTAARKLWHTDGLQEAIRNAREATDKKAAAAALEKAIKRYPAAIYRYEAKSLLVDLGGPDLFEPGERVGDDDG